MGFAMKSLAFAALVAQVLAHGRIDQITVGGKTYPGQYQYNENDQSPHWLVSDGNSGGPAAVNDESMVCGDGAVSPKEGVVIDCNPGDKISIKWTEWPESHMGPILDYIAPCKGACSSDSKTSLEFVKIQEASGSGNNNWPTLKMIANGLTWDVTLPSSLAPGNYVLRHEIVALHKTGEPENYPKCFTLKVGGSGGSTPSGGVTAGKLYNLPGDFPYNLYDDKNEFPPPGPKLWNGAGSSNNDNSPNQPTNEGDGNGQDDKDNKNDKDNKDDKKNIGGKGGNPGVNLYQNSDDQGDGQDDGQDDNQQETPDTSVRVPTTGYTPQNDGDQGDGKGKGKKGKSMNCRRRKSKNKRKVKKSKRSVPAPTPVHAYAPAKSTFATVVVN